MTQKFYLKAFLQTLLILFLLGTIANAATIHVNNGDNLDAKIESAKGGDTVLVAPGTYGPISLNNKDFTADKPVIIKRDGTGNVSVDGWGDRAALRLDGSSYLYFEGMQFTNSYWEAVGIWNDSHHIILVNCDVVDTQRIGIKVAGQSHHVDIIGGSVGDVGTGQATYGEGIYIGQAQQAVDRVHDVWIEGVEIYNCGTAEAINTKSEAYNITIRDCHIHDIDVGEHPGHTNMGGIACEAGADTHRDLNVWIENNLIERVHRWGSISPGWGQCINFSNNPGVRITGNTIRDCQDYGIRAYTYNGEQQPYQNYIADNSFSGNPTDINISSGINVKYTDPGPNPFSPQSWGPNGTPSPEPEPEPEPTETTCDNPTPETGVVPARIEVSTHDGNGPCHLMDNDLGTRWSADGQGQWAQFDLGEVKEIEAVEIAFYKGESRTATFDLEFSNDGNNWTPLLTQEISSGTTSDLESFTFTVQSARYLRYVGYGNSSNIWNSLLEVRIVAAANLASQLITGLSVHSRSGEQDSNSTVNLYDGITEDMEGARWSAIGLPTAQWVMLDLGGCYALDGVDLFPYQQRDYQYQVEVAPAASGPWTTVVDRSSNTAGGAVISDEVAPSAMGCFCRLTVTGADTYTGPWVSINELSLYGTPSAD